MAKYTIRCPVERAEGTQIWTVMAASEEEAIRKFRAGEGEFGAEEVDVVALGEPEIIGVEP